MLRWRGARKMQRRRSSGAVASRLAGPATGGPSHRGERRAQSLAATPAPQLLTPPPSALRPLSFVLRPPSLCPVPNSAASQDTNNSSVATHRAPERGGDSLSDGCGLDTGSNGKPDGNLGGEPRCGAACNLDAAPHCVPKRGKYGLVHSGRTGPLAPTPPRRGVGAHPLVLLQVTSFLQGKMLIRFAHHIRNLANKPLLCDVASAATVHDFYRRDPAAACRSGGPGGLEACLRADPGERVRAAREHAGPDGAGGV